ncbi:hypothetical protein Bca4012_098115 [Brassica carinata]
MVEPDGMYGRCTALRSVHSPYICTFIQTSSMVDPYTFLDRPSFAPMAIFSLTPPNSSHDQSKSLLNLTSQDRYFKTLLKLD